MNLEFNWEMNNSESAGTLMKSSLSPRRAILIELMQLLRYGWIRNLLVRDGEPDLTETVGLTQNVKLMRPDRSLPHSVALKRMKMDAQSFQKLTQTLVQQGDIEAVTVKTAGRGGIAYRLREG